VAWKRQLEHVAIELGVDLDVGECELLDRLVLFVEQARLQRQARARVGPELVSITHAILWARTRKPRFPTGDSRRLGLAKVIVFGERRQFAAAATRGTRCAVRGSTRTSLASE
jgi:hypothetical protein